MILVSSRVCVVEVQSGLTKPARYGCFVKENATIVCDMKPAITHAVQVAEIADPPWRHLGVKTLLPRHRTTKGFDAAQFDELAKAVAALVGPRRQYDGGVIYAPDAVLRFGVLAIDPTLLARSFAVEPAWASETEQSLRESAVVGGRPEDPALYARAAPTIVAAREDGLAAV